MDTVFQQIEVAFRYPVHFTTGVFDLSNPLLKDAIAAEGGEVPARAVFVVDRGLLRGHRGLAASIKRYCSQHSETMVLAAPVLVVPGGERVKNHPRRVKDIQRVINDSGLCRHSYVVAVSGGAVLH